MTNSGSNNNSIPSNTWFIPGGNVTGTSAPQQYVFTWNYGPQAPVTPVETKSEKPKICICKKCDEVNEYAEPNQSDGSFMCYRCRKGY